MLCNFAQHWQSLLILDEYVLMLISLHFFSDDSKVNRKQKTKVAKTVSFDDVSGGADIRSVTNCRNEKGGLDICKTFLQRDC